MFGATVCEKVQFIAKKYRYGRSFTQNVMTKRTTDVESCIN